ncbi:hypothetical protein SDC9_63546 [bioreactor metagenome]|uniref:Uncharacterized protein n=1 Tax=bioreactor metagenome TaxID=1076179 RepID=A0A644XN06_9ZZZZ
MSEQLQKPHPEEQPEQPETPEVINTEPEELDDLQKRIRDYSDRKWNAILTVCGGLVGLLCGALLTVFSAMESIGMYGTIGAVVIALLLPRFAEKRVKRSVQKGRVAMMISLALWLAVTAAVMIIKGVPIFTK